MKINFVGFTNEEANNFDKLNLTYQIRTLIHTFHNEKLPISIRENAFNKINDLTKKLTS